MEAEVAATSQIEPAVMTVNEVANWARVGRTKIYEEINSGALAAFKFGRRTYITADAARAWLASQPAYCLVDAA